MSNQFMLPKTFLPKFYKIWIDEIDVEKNTFTGKVTIALDTLKSDSVIQLHTRELSIEDAFVELEGDEGNKFAMVSHSYDKVTEIASLQFPNEITSACSLYISYSGVLSNNMSGFYRSNYKDVKTGEDKWMLSTQFEATDARRAFPCFDEPNLKAHFEIMITASERYTVLANMPEKEVIKNGTLQTHVFYASPFMSTYLVAWAVGEFQYIESKTDKNIYPTLDDYNIEDGTSKTYDHMPIRIYTAEGKAHQGEFAMTVAEKVVDLFSELFEIPYPLPKLDILCVESYSHNAMENFSLITFRPSSILYDGKLEDAQFSEQAKKAVYVLCHEIAHQWFGNMVTMNWWDELWLNEGFATWVGYYAVEKLFPEWGVSVMTMLDAREVALDLDSLESSHPIKVGVHDPKDIDQLFDTISYLKGFSFLSMVSGYFGEDVFLKGTALYLKRHKFRNATMNDLFACIGEIAKIEITSKVQPWILDIGFPVLSIENDSEDEGSFLITQRRCLQDDTKNVSPSKWWVPLMMTDGSSEQFDKVLTDSTSSLKLTHSFNFFNTEGHGFYRIEYKFSKLLDSIFSNLEKLSSRSLISLISDISVTGSTKNFFKLLTAISKSLKFSNPSIWKLIVKKLFALRRVLCVNENFSTLDKMDKFVFTIFKPLTEPALNYLRDPQSVVGNKNDNTKLEKVELYNIVLEFLGGLSHPEVVRESLKIYESNSVKEINRAIVLTTLLSQPTTTRKQFEEICHQLSKSSLGEMETILSCLGCVRNEELFIPCLNLLTTIEEMNVQFLAASLGRNPFMQDAIVDFVRRNKKLLFERMSINAVVISRFVSFTFSNFSGRTVLDEIKLLFEDEDVTLYDRFLLQTLERIELSTNKSSKRASELKAYFE